MKDADLVWVAHEFNELRRIVPCDRQDDRLEIIVDTIKVMLYVGSLDVYLMELKSLVRKGRPHPVLDTRSKLASHVRENLKTLGLERRTKPITLQDVLDNHTE